MINLQIRPSQKYWLGKLGTIAALMFFVWGSNSFWGLDGDETDKELFRRMTISGLLALSLWYMDRWPITDKRKSMARASFGIMQGLYFGLFMVLIQAPDLEPDVAAVSFIVSASFFGAAMAYLAKQPEYPLDLKRNEILRVFWSLIAICVAFLIALIGSQSVVKAVFLATMGLFFVPFPPKAGRPKPDEQVRNVIFGLCVGLSISLFVSA